MLITVMISPSDDLETSIEHLYKFHFITCDQKLKKIFDRYSFYCDQFQNETMKAIFLFPDYIRKNDFIFNEKKNGRLSSFRKLRNKNYTTF